MSGPGRGYSLSGYRPSRHQSSPAIAAGTARISRKIGSSSATNYPDLSRRMQAFAAWLETVLADALDGPQPAQPAHAGERRRAPRQGRDLPSRP